MIAARQCSKPACSRSAVATLTYDYQDSTVVLGPLATVAEPNSYDLCADHAQRLTAPRGWQVVRLATSFEPAPPSGDDLLALVDAVRQAAHADTTSSRDTQAPHQDTHSSTRRSIRARLSGVDDGVDFGPFSSHSSGSAGSDGASSSSRANESEGSGDSSLSPLDPKSPYARRRAQFRVVSSIDEDEAAPSDAD
ncbi:DUF3499 domain-containing protein [Schaalia sp. ZJ405]|uniref:DUF3499 domain-containing protein n=1 Tax=Schaalia sp. ZJ405 TaxID=2709403 RepID=UPI0013ECA2F8|nr:DUF3499 domain-containing protein [Schaalia sp. ZJ405]QPK81725.1 DUF3499 domain-containing protein [Schaalia sp. ZJ405]